MELSDASGVPDVNLCLMGDEIWIEMKIMLPSGLRAKVRAEQVSWLTRRWAVGGAAFLLVYCPKEKLFYVIYRHAIMEFADGGLDAVAAIEGFEDMEENFAVFNTCKNAVRFMLSGDWR